MIDLTKPEIAVKRLKYAATDGRVPAPLETGDLPVRPLARNKVVAAMHGIRMAIYPDEAGLFPVVTGCGHS